VECRLTPNGRIEVLEGTTDDQSIDDGPTLAPTTARRIVRAFGRGNGPGLLHLGAQEIHTELPSALSYWRRIGRDHVAAACAAQDPEDPTHVSVPAMTEEQGRALIDSVPPMPGAETITCEFLDELWADIGAALVLEAERSKGGLQGYLGKRSTVWHVVGRVCLHLAENKGDLNRPFAFIATYVHGMSHDGQAQHRPLGRALREYAGAGNRKKLLALLAPMARAAERSELLGELLDCGDIYEPLAWSPAEAHQFLSEIELYEQSGLVVRTPDWWSSSKRSRPRVSVSVGNEAPSALGMDALLDFNVELTLGGKKLSANEIDALLAGAESLVLIKGQWVEVDRQKLSRVLEHWNDIQAKALAGEIDFATSMRILAGADLGGGESDELREDRPEWSEVVAGKWLSSRLDALRSPKFTNATRANAGLRAELRPYQKDGVEWLWMLRGLRLGGCLADDMGLGKTIQVLAVLSMCRRSKEPGTDLLVVPASLLDNWRAEAQRFAPSLDMLIAHPSRLPSRQLKELSDHEIAAHDVVVTSYATLARTQALKSHRWRNVILDEAQAIKNPSAKQTRVVKALEAGWRVALTGTPVENQTGDLWSIFDFLNPGLLGSAKAFQTFCRTMATDEKADYAPLRRLVQPYILRRLKTDKSVISDLPDKTEVNAYCLLSKRQAALYKQSVDEMKTAIASTDGIKRRGIVLAFLLRFKQICNHPSLWLGDGEFADGDSGKFERLRELTESIAARQNKLLVFTQFRKMTVPISRFLADAFGHSGLVLHGGTPVAKRQGLVQSFQNDERVPFMVLSLKAGGTGLNLTAASHVIHFDRWWNPAVENQATDRAFRIGQKKNVVVHKFICQGTVEERIDELIAGKKQLSNEILKGGAERKLTEMTNDELLAMVSLDLQSAVEG
jgi:superfamily II DNA or RNA helicase